MALNLALPEQQVDLKPRIVVLGVGGAGGNAVNTMIQSELQGVEFVVANTDAQALAQSLAPSTIQLGTTETRGLGAGSKPDVGQAAAEETIAEVMDAIADANLIFIAAGMGGGTGTGAAPVIARAARERGILTVAVVTKPFRFEGVPRMRLAEKGIEALQANVDTLITIPNQNLFRIANDRTTFADAFKMADDVLYEGVRGISDLMVQPGLINLDFADVRALMSVMGKAMMGLGEGEGECRAIEAAEAAISNPLLEDGTMRGAMGVLINIAGGPDLTLFEVDEAANRVREEVDPEANIIFGSSFDPVLQGRIRISVVATGIDGEAVAGYETAPEAAPVTQAPRSTGDSNGGSVSASGNPTPESPVYAPRRVARPAGELQNTLGFEPASPEVGSPEISSPEISGPGISGPEVSSPEVSGPGIGETGPGAGIPPQRTPVSGSFVPSMPAPPIPPGMTQTGMDPVTGQGGLQSVDRPADRVPNLTAGQPAGQISGQISGQTSGTIPGFARSSGLFSRIKNFANNSNQPFGNATPPRGSADPLSADAHSRTSGQSRPRNQEGYQDGHQEGQTYGFSETAPGYEAAPLPGANPGQGAPLSSATGHALNEQNPDHQNPDHQNPNHQNPNHQNPNHQNRGHQNRGAYHPAFDEDLLEIPAFLRRQAN